MHSNDLQTALEKELIDNSQAKAVIDLLTPYDGQEMSDKIFDEIQQKLDFKITMTGNSRCKAITFPAGQIVYSYRPLTRDHNPNILNLEYILKKNQEILTQAEKHNQEINKIINNQATLYQIAATLSRHKEVKKEINDLLKSLTSTKLIVAVRDIINDY